LILDGHLGEKKEKSNDIGAGKWQKTRQDLLVNW